MRRHVPVVVLYPFLALAFGGVASATVGSKALDASWFEPCDFPQLLPIDRVVNEERGFAFALPPEAQPVERIHGFDHEYGRWDLPDGGMIEFQYGFDVTQLSSWVGDRQTTSCLVSLDGKDAVYFERRAGGEPSVFAYGLLDPVHSYGVSTEGVLDADALPEDFVLIGQGPDTSMFELGREMARTFRWSRLPEAAAGAYEIVGQPGRGVVVFETSLGLPAAIVGDYEEQTGAPRWRMGVPGPVVISHPLRLETAEDIIEEESATVMAVPMLFVQTQSVPADTPSGEAIVFADQASAEFQVELGADGCERARLLWRQPGGEALDVLELRRVSRTVKSCSRFRAEAVPAG